ncbi:MAG: BMC domain-containing protein [Leptolyngbya sp. SIO1E4]|nr:BMC domain-containing protein [Leptolyngbya sp. SIO1E4]
MAQAMGVIETCGVPAALVAADIMGKSASVQVVGIENTDLARISVMIRGSTGAVKTALMAAVSGLAQHPGAKVLGYHLLPCPTGDTDTIMTLRQIHRLSDDELDWLDD